MKILVAMSGGVDSSVAAKILKEEGNECIGCTMKLYANEDAGIPRAHTCCSLDDVFDARSVAYSLGMPYYVFNFKDDFKEKVIDKFVKSYLAGATPNPCIDCNRFMKFDKLFERMEVLGCDHVATGHYARVEKDKNGKFLLKKAVDDTKDQSYVLYSLTQFQLERTLFPLGSLTKNKVREIAGDGGLVNAEKPDSQDICFVPDGDIGKIIRLHSGLNVGEGKFVDKSGNVLGTHDGYFRYTIGQRKGLGVAAGKRIFVTKIIPEKNLVVLGDEDELFSKEAFVADVNRIAGGDFEKEFFCEVATRYRGKAEKAKVVPQESGKLKIIFDKPVRAVTAGQAAVLYDGETVLGGGTIVSGQK